MTFLHPALAMVGLGAVSLPIIIHLLIRRRVKPVRWAAMKFLLEAYKQRRRRLILEQLLLLATRCLLVACIAIALGRLLVGGNSGAGIGAGPRPTSLVIVIDDSLTSAADGALERHKEQAASLLSQLDPGSGDTASLITLSRPAQGVVMPATSDIGALGGIVERLTPTDAGADLAGAIAAINAATTATDAEQRPRVVVAVLSDFLAGSVDLQAPLDALEPPPDAIVVSAVRAEGVSNTAIVGVEPLRSVVTGGRSLAASNQVRVTLRRAGPEVASASTKTVRVLTTREGGGSETLGQATARFETGQQESTVIMQADVGPPESGARASRIIAASIDRDSLAADDTVERVIEFRDSIRVAVIAPRRFQQPGESAGIDRFDAADWVTLALEPSAPSISGLGIGTRADIETARVEPNAITASRLTGFDAIALCAPQSLDQTGWEAIGAFVGQGGLLIVMPPKDVAIHLWADQLSEMGVGWSIGREPRDLDSAQLVDAATTPAAGTDLLSLVRPELPELSRSVTVRRILPVSLDGERREGPLLGLADGTPLVVAAVPQFASTSPNGRGLVVMFATSLDLAWTDLPAKPLVVPLMQEIVRQGVGAARGAWHSLAGSSPAIPVGTTELRSSGVSFEGDGRVSPDTAVSIAIEAGSSSAPAIRRAGIYRAMDAQGSTRAWLSIAPDARASDTNPSTPEVVRAWIASVAPNATISELGSEPSATSGSLTSALIASRSTPDRSLAFLIAALALLLIELFLARWSSHARTFGESGGIVPGRPGVGGAGA